MNVVWPILTKDDDNADIHENIGNNTVPLHIRKSGEILFCQGDKTYTAKQTEHGKIEYNGVIYDSPREWIVTCFKNGGAST